MPGWVDAGEAAHADIDDHNVAGFFAERHMVLAGGVGGYRKQVCLREFIWSR